MRPLLPAADVGPTALAGVSGFHADVVEAARGAIASHEWVVIGMAHNPFVGKARKALTAKQLPFHYIGHGNYFSQWKPRLAIKLWSGWPTFPQVFHNGKLIGGANELISYLG
jgi:glutaredoxin-related protein